MRKVSILLFVMLLTGSKVAAQQGKEETRPLGEIMLDDPLPGNWSEGEYFSQTLPVDDGWWRNFNDPVLDSLIAVAGSNNYSVLAAMENIKKARAAWRVSQNKLMPQFDLGMGWQRAKTSGNIASTLYNEAWEGQFSTAVSMQ